MQNLCSPSQVAHFTVHWHGEVSGRARLSALGSKFRNSAARSASAGHHKSLCPSKVCVLPGTNMFSFDNFQEALRITRRKYKPLFVSFLIAGELCCETSEGLRPVRGDRIIISQDSAPIHRRPRGTGPWTGEGHFPPAGGLQCHQKCCLMLQREKQDFYFIIETTRGVTRDSS